jgi:hypothetical protein
MKAIGVFGDFAAKCLLLKQEWRRQLEVIAFVQYVIGGPTFWVRAALTFTRALEPMVLPAFGEELFHQQLSTASSARGTRAAGDACAELHLSLFGW